MKRISYISLMSILLVIAALTLSPLRAIADNWNGGQSVRVNRSMPNMGRNEGWNPSSRSIQSTNRITYQNTPSHNQPSYSNWSSDRQPVHIENRNNISVRSYNYQNEGTRRQLTRQDYPNRYEATSRGIDKNLDSRTIRSNQSYDWDRIGEQRYERRDREYGQERRDGGLYPETTHIRSYPSYTTSHRGSRYEEGYRYDRRRDYDREYSRYSHYRTKRYPSYAHYRYPYYPRYYYYPYTSYYRSYWSESPYVVYRRPVVVYDYSYYEPYYYVSSSYGYDDYLSLSFSYFDDDFWGISFSWFSD